MHFNVKDENVTKILDIVTIIFENFLNEKHW